MLRISTNSQTAVAQNSLFRPQQTDPPANRQQHPKQSNSICDPRPTNHVPRSEKGNLRARSARILLNPRRLADKLTTTAGGKRPPRPLSRVTPAPPSLGPPPPALPLRAARIILCQSHAGLGSVGREGGDFSPAKRGVIIGKKRVCVRGAAAVFTSLLGRGVSERGEVKPFRERFCEYWAGSWNVTACRTGG